MWLISPAVADGEHVNNVYYSGELLYDYIDADNIGFRPVVYIRKS